MKKQIYNQNVINFEVMGGWPIEKMNIREILQKFGAKFNKETNNWEIPESSTLDIFPRRLEDDGMGYGVNMQYIISVDIHEEEKESYCNIFTEDELDYIDVWKRNNIFPGMPVYIDNKEYVATNVDETDNGFIFTFKCYDDKNIITILESNLEDFLKNPTTLK